MVINLLNKLKIECENHSKGCEVIMTIEEMDKHLSLCDKNCISCKILKEKISESESEVKQLNTQLVSLENKMKDLREKLEKNRLSPQFWLIKQVCFNMFNFIF